MSLVEKIKLLFAIKKPAADLVGQVKEIKRGYKTLAFWISLFATLTTISGVLTAHISGITALLVFTSIGVVYNVLRAFKKADEAGIRSPWVSTEFWMGLITIVGNGFVALQNGGYMAPWVITGSAIVTAFMSVSQNVGAAQPEHASQ